MSAGALALGEKGTFIVPVSLEALGPVAEAPELLIGRLRLVRKREHHSPVLGFSIAKLVRRSLTADPELRAAIDGVIGAYDWTMRPGSRLYPLHLDNERGVLHTVIVLVEADLAGFYERVRTLVASRGDAHADLGSALGSAPPPHVTLYTSDPRGQDGIGLNQPGGLDLALRGPEAGEAGLRAYRLSEAVMLATKDG